MMLKVTETGLKELSSQPWDFMPTAAELFIQAGQLDRAADCISQLRQKDIAPAVTAFLEGLLADRRGQGYQAVRCWQRAMGLGNKSPQIRLVLASALSGLGDTQSALWQLRTFVSERPGSFEGHLALARLLAQTVNFTQAAEHAWQCSFRRQTRMLFCFICECDCNCWQPSQKVKFKCGRQCWRQWKRPRNFRI
jgi:thioredoxin-like negative regulator of GroEL